MTESPLVRQRAIDVDERRNERAIAATLLGLSLPELLGIQAGAAAWCRDVTAGSLARRRTGRRGGPWQPPDGLVPVSEPERGLYTRGFRLSPTGVGAGSVDAMPR